MKIESLPKKNKLRPIHNVISLKYTVMIAFAHYICLVIKNNSVDEYLSFYFQFSASMTQSSRTSPFLPQQGSATALNHRCARRTLDKLKPSKPSVSKHV